MDHRHHTLRNTFDWSHDLLSPPEQVLLRRLAVFVGGFLKIAETVCADGEVNRKLVLDLLTSLVNKSLVVAQTLQRDEARYSLLETILQYAQEKLIASGEWQAIRDRHMQFFLEFKRGDSSET